MEEGADFILPAKTYTITPEQTSVDILLIVIDDNFVENDEVGEVIVEASVPFVSLGNEIRRTVSVRILDDDGKVASFDSN